MLQWNMHAAHSLQEYCDSNGSCCTEPTRTDADTWFLSLPPWLLVPCLGPALRSSPSQHPETLPSLSAAEVISANEEVTSCQQGHLSARVFFCFVFQRHARTETFAQFF